MAFMSISEAEPGSGAAAAARAAMATGARPFRAILGSLANLLLPPVCISCGTRILSHGLL
jgi:hypothetical protein